jgi:hypothetical protein
MLRVPQHETSFNSYKQKNPGWNFQPGFLVFYLLGDRENYFTSSKSTSVTLSALPSA